MEGCLFFYGLSKAELIRNIKSQENNFFGTLNLSWILYDLLKMFCREKSNPPPCSKSELFNPSVLQFTPCCYYSDFLSTKGLKSEVNIVACVIWSDSSKPIKQCVMWLIDPFHWEVTTGTAQSIWRSVCACKVPVCWCQPLLTSCHQLFVWSKNLCKACYIILLVNVVMAACFIAMSPSECLQWGGQQYSWCHCIVYIL